MMLRNTTNKWNAGMRPAMMLRSVLRGAFSVDWSAIRAGAVARPCRETAVGVY